MTPPFLGLGEHTVSDRGEAAMTSWATRAYAELELLQSEDGTAERRIVRVCCYTIITV